MTQTERIWTTENTENSEINAEMQRVRTGDWTKCLRFGSAFFSSVFSVSRWSICLENTQFEHLDKETLASTDDADPTDARPTFDVAAGRRYPSSRFSDASNRSMIPLDSRGETRHRLI